jgi:hypothetical protein
MQYSRLDHVDTTLESILEVALATATSEDLGLDDEAVALDGLGDLLGLGGREGRLADGGGDAVLSVSGTF